MLPAGHVKVREGRVKRRMSERKVIREKKCTAIVLAAGSGRRMGTRIQKQYLELEGKPVLYYCLCAFQQSDYIDEIVLVTGQNEIEYCRKEIVERYEFDKVVQITAGGKERYESVYYGLQHVEEGIVFIHDGARPFVEEEMLRRAYECVLKERACAVGMPVKDTIKIVDQEQHAVETPDRAYVWQVQTPQVFDVRLVRAAYEQLMQSGWEKATDDAMVVEKMTEHPVRLVLGSYENIKITTPEDLEIAGLFIKRHT